MKLIKEIQAHPVNVYSIAAHGNTVYTCSNDGTIQSWDTDSLEKKKTLIENPSDEQLRLFAARDGKLYSGDDKGNIRVWVNDEQVGNYEVGEEVWDLLVKDNLLFTVRNLDVSVTEMIEGPKSLYCARGSFHGRSPLRMLQKYICFMGRCGRVINIHEISKENNFKKHADIQAHELIVNAMCCKEEPNPTIYSGGYDKTVKSWDLETQKSKDSIELDTCINFLCDGPAGHVYVGGINGYLARISPN